MPVIICPGIHPTESTDLFVQALQPSVQQEFLVLPTGQYPPYSAIAVYQWLDLQRTLFVPCRRHGQIEDSALSTSQPLTFVCFSAGVVGGFGAALAWQLGGGKIHGLVAMDGWGMPLIANFPIYRVSHDYFTHWSSAILGAGQSGFYADPAVEHLAIWRSPEVCYGWRTISSGCKTRSTLINYLADVLNS